MATITGEKGEGEAEGNESKVRCIKDNAMIIGRDKGSFDNGEGLV